MKKVSLLAFFLALALADAQEDGSGGGANTRLTIIAHGFLMSLAFLIFFPFGALSIRILTVKHAAWFHGSFQLFAYSMATAGAGLGIWIAVTQQELTGFPHSIIGLIVWPLLCFQPIVGWIHHYIIGRERRNTWIGGVHRWFGRFLILLGAINGGLGLQLSANTIAGEIAYGVIAGTMFLLYVGVDVMACASERRKEKGKQIQESGPRSPDKTTNVDADMFEVKV